MTFPWLRALIAAFLGRVPGKPGRDDTATRVARDADFRGRGEPSNPSARALCVKVDLIAEIERPVARGNKCVGFWQPA